MFLDILQHTPIWVWLILAAVTALGLRQTRPRAMTGARVRTMSLVFILLSLSGVLRAGGSPLLVLAAWAAGFGVVVGFARRALAVRGASWSPQTSHLQIPGSWLPLALILGLFVLKYSIAVSLSVQPALRQDLTLTIACQAIYGVFAAAFWLRARSLLRLIPQTTELGARLPAGH